MHFMLRSVNEPENLCLQQEIHKYICEPHVNARVVLWLSTLLQTQTVLYHS